MAVVLCLQVAAEEQVAPVHALAIHGEPKYPADFTHLDYANPDAPKGGQIRLGTVGTFDSFNPYIAKGTPFGSISVEMLGAQTQDDPNVEYGLIAETFEVPEDRSWLIVNLNPRARWHDGKAITADDVVWTFETLMKKGHPQYRYYYANVTSAEKLAERRVKFSFDEKNNRELPNIVLQLPVLPKHYWASRDFEKTTLEPPLGSGPYKIASFEAGRFVVLERVEDYWGADLPIKSRNRQLRPHPLRLLQGFHTATPGAQERCD